MRWILLLALALVCHAVDRNLDWSFNNVPYADYHVYEGDTVTFTFLDFVHHIKLVSTPPCTGFSNPPNGTGTTSPYVFTVPYGGDPAYNFGCDVSTHCVSGLHLKVINDGPAPPPSSSSAAFSSSTQNLALTTTSSSSCGETFSITALADASEFTVNGQAGNPTLHLSTGCVYVFNVNTDVAHPVKLTVNSDNSDNGVSAGVSGTMDINSGTFSYTPQFAGTVFYQCTVHHFSGRVEITGASQTSGAVPSTYILSIYFNVMVLCFFLFGVPEMCSSSLGCLA